MDKWVCKVCGYIYEGAEPPAECPVCHAPASQFKKVEGELELAAEHEYGVYDKTVKDNPNVSDEDKAYILEQLKANFNGECSEVGMYLCMARIAHREGYPEVGLYWEKAAYEEAERPGRHPRHRPRDGSRRGSSRQGPQGLPRSPVLSHELKDFQEEAWQEGQALKARGCGALGA